MMSSNSPNVKPVAPEKPTKYRDRSKVIKMSYTDHMHETTKTMKQDDFRPQLFSQVIGQIDTVEYLREKIIAFKKTRKNPSHTLFLGPSGLGKTTLANVMAKEMGVTFHQIMATRIKTPTDLYNIIKIIEEGDVVFIDEIHALSEKIQEHLYGVMEDFTYSIEDKNLNRPRLVKIPRFTLIGATTHSGLLTSALISRFGYKAYLQPYSQEDLTKMIITAGDRIYDIDVPHFIANKLAKLSRSTARIAYNLLHSLMVLAEAQTPGKVTPEMLDFKLLYKMLKYEKIDPIIGLDITSRKYLVKLLREQAPVGSKTLANHVGEQEITVISTIEPFLLSDIELEYKDGDRTRIQKGPFIRITSKGRMTLEPALNYIKVCQYLQKDGWFTTESLNVKSE